MDRATLDWVNAPQGAQEIALWSCMHDGDVLRVSSDRLRRTLEMELDVFYIREHWKLPDEHRFVLRFDGVQSVRAAVQVPWPGGIVIPEGASREEQTRLGEEYWGKWREESVAWDAFERDVATEPLDVSDASMLRGDGGALRASVYRAGGPFYSVVVRAERLDVVGSDGGAIGLERFMAMGDAYWDAFEARNAPK